jgi:hypothetical protein
LGESKGVHEGGRVDCRSGVVEVHEDGMWKWGLEVREDEA